MKKVTSILLAVYFLLGSLTPKMDFQQLLHLSCAVQHYSEHCNEAVDNGTTFTFIDFMMDHYLDPANHANKSESGHQEHPCTHSHNHTVDFAKIELDFPNLSLVEEDLLVQDFSKVTSLYSADFISGLEEPPTFI